jgi:pyruvate dehydrogenase E1 component alpha subunit
MLLIRRFEEKAGQLYGMGLIGGFCHLYIGQEAVVVGMQAASRQGDRSSPPTATTATCWPAAWTPSGVMAELTGRVGGYSKGKGGSMHMFSREKNFYGGHGIVGAQVPLGTGWPSRNKYAATMNGLGHLFRRRRRNQGQVYESFNMASLWKLPVIYMIENNRYAMGTSIERAPATPTELFKRGAASAFRASRWTAWMCWPCAMRPTGREALRARANGPYILEMKTYRYRGHSMSDPAKYRTKEEVAEDARGARPDRAAERPAAGEQGHATEDDLKKIDAEIARHRERGRRVRATPARSPIRPSCGPTFDRRPRNDRHAEPS